MNKDIIKELVFLFFGVLIIGITVFVNPHYTFSMFGYGWGLGSGMLFLIVIKKAFG